MLHHSFLPYIPAEYNVYFYCSWFGEIAARFFTRILTKDNKNYFKKNSVQKFISNFNKCYEHIYDNILL